MLHDQGTPGTSTYAQQHTPQPSQPYSHHTYDGFDQQMNGQDLSSTELLASVHPGFTAREQIGPSSWPLESNPLNENSFSGRPGVSSRPIELSGSELLDHLYDTSLSEKLTKLFLKHLNPIYQIVDTGTLHFDIQEEQEDGVSQLLRSAVCAAGACFSDIPYAEGLAHTILRYAESKVLPACRKDTGLVVLQALIVLAWCEMTLNNEAIGLTYIQIAGGIVLNLDLHILGLADGQPQAVISSSHMRSFWSYFMVDRMSCAALDRHSAIPWHRIKTPTFGSIINLPSASIDEVVFDHQNRLWFLHERLCEPIYAHGFASLPPKERVQLLAHAQQAHADFLARVDQRLMPANISQAEKPVLIFQLSYQTAVLMVHRPFTRSLTDALFQSSLLAMTAAADSITRLIKQFITGYSFADTVPVVLYFIFRAAVVHLLNATSTQADLRQSSIDGIKICIEALEDGSRRFRTQGHRFIKTIRELAQKWRVVYALPVGLMAQHLGVDSSLGHATDRNNTATTGFANLPVKSEWTGALDPQLEDGTGFNTLDPQLQGGGGAGSLDPQLQGDAGLDASVPAGVDTSIEHTDDFLSQWSFPAAFEEPNVLDHMAWPLERQRLSTMS